jgi:hypothetical protein
MAAGDAYQVGSSLITASTGFLNCQPGSSVEIVVHNIYCGAAAELQFWDGSNAIIIDTTAAGGGFLNQAFHCTNTKYIRVRNAGVANAYFAADGMVTK